MKHLITYTIIFLPLMLQSQYMQPWDRPYHKLLAKVKAEVSWEEVLEFANIDSTLRNGDYAADITSTIEFMEQDINEKTTIDDLMISLCKKKHRSIRFYASGLKQSRHHHGKQFPVGLESDSHEVVPQLIDYLKNDSATRQIAGSFASDDNDEAMLSISDLALQFLENHSLCDFYRRSLFHNSSLFSNRSENERKEITERINKWWSATKDLDKVSATNYFLDSMNIDCSSYTKTCYNILNYGDTLTAVKRFRQYYNQNNTKCRNHYLVGKTLYDLGDKGMIDDCLGDMYNYASKAPYQCVNLLLENAEFEYQFDVLADIVATERHSRYRQGNETCLWHYIVSGIAKTQNKLSKSILIELFSIDQKVKDLRITTFYWERRFKQEFHDELRVCDLALLKYLELFSENEIIIEWKNINSIDREIANILKKTEANNR